MKRPLTLAVIVLLASSALLSGCNTVRGVGEDVQQAGSAIQKAADK